ncbi:uncharacterized protein, partial [Magallana gigas]|uniref:uncharacterized protein n=1 Tax=Magallana gigas TaxID=29159 RepID=UPI00333E9FA8
MTNNVHNEYKTSYLIPNSPISATETFHNVGVELISSNWHDNAHSKLPSSVTERGTIGDNLNTISPPSSLGFGLKNEENLIVTNTVDSMNSVFQSSMPYLAQHSSTEETSILQTGMVQHLESVVQTLASNISSTIPLPQRALSIELSTEAPRNALTTMQMSDHKPSLISLDLFSTVVSHTSKEDALSHTRGSAVFSPQITTNTLVGEGEVPFNADIFGDTQLEDLLNAILSERQQSESSSLISDNIIRNKTTKTTSGLVPISTQLEMSEYIHSKVDGILTSTRLPSTTMDRLASVTPRLTLGTTDSTLSLPVSMLTPDSIPATATPHLSDSHHLIPTTKEMVTQFYPTLPVSSTEPSSSSLNGIDPISHSISAIMSSHIAEASNSILSKTFEESEFFQPSIVISTSIILSENKSSLSSNEIISSPSSAFHQMNSTSLEVLDSSKDQLSTLFGVSSILLAAMTNSSEMFYTTSLNPASSQTQSKNWLSSKSYNFPSSVLVSNRKSKFETSEATELTSSVEDHVTSYSMMQTHSSQAVLEYSTSFIAQNSPIHSLKDVSSKEVTTSNILSPIFSEDGEGSMYTSMSSKVYPSRTSTDLQQSKVSQFTSSIEFVESSSNSTLQPSSHVAILSSSNVIRTEPLTSTLPLSTTFLSPSVTGVQSSPSAFTRSSVDSQSVVLSSGVINQQNTDKVVYVSSSISSFSTDFLPETETSKSSGYS